MAAQDLPSECPVEATLELVGDPKRWADQCFFAVSGRFPNASNIGESSTVSRDLDLDGIAEHLEIRGTGNASKQIYVFSKAVEGFRYLGQLNAHPSFVVVLDANGVPTVEYLHRLSADETRRIRIQYMENRFVELSQATP